MKSIICKKPGTFALETQSTPPLSSGNALLRMTRLGVCGTDLHAYAGRQPFFSYPRILGHEMAAEVVEIGPNKEGLKVGDQVAVVPYIECGFCIACRNGKSNCCVNMNVLGVHSDGGMREYLSVPINHLLKHDTLSPDHLALCECFAIGAHAVRRAAITKGEQVLVVGAGPIGLGVMQCARLAGGSVIAMDISQERLAFAARHVELADIIDAGRDGAVREQISAATSGDFPTVIFDATGNARSMMDSFLYLAHGGRYVLVSLVNADISFSDPEFHKRETTLLSSRNATVEDFHWVMAHMSSNQLRVEPLVTHRCNLTETIEQFARWTTPEARLIKAIIEF